MRMASVLPLMLWHATVNISHDICVCRCDIYFPTRPELSREMSWSFENAASAELFTGTV